MDIILCIYTFSKITYTVILYQGRNQDVHDKDYPEE
jgi:hypothetical protein